MSVRAKHQAAYAASMFSLLIFQLIVYASDLSYLSSYHLDIVYTLISQILCMGLIPFSVLMILKREDGIRGNLAYMRYKKPKDLRVCLLASLGLMLLITPFTMVFNALTTLLLKIIGYKRNFPAPTIYGGAGDFFLFAFITAVLPATFEEFTHRGVLLSGLEDRGSELSAVLLSAICFGLMHTNPVQFLYAAVGGVVFGIAVTKTGSILPAMCAHFANNFVSVLLDYSTQKENAFGVLYESVMGASSFWGLVIMLAILGLSVYGVVRILQYLARNTEKPVMEKKLFGVIAMDAYRPDGKATLKDNAFLIATMIADTFMLIALIIWGIAR